MLQQTFASPFSPEAPTVVITWTGEFRDVEVLSAGQVLTRIPEPDALRTTGLRGTTPAGDEIVVRLAADGGPEPFVVTRNGIQLLASPTHGRQIAGAASTGAASTAMPWSMSKAEPAPTPAVVPAEPVKQKKTARTWLQVLGSLQTLVGSALVIVSFRSAEARIIAFRFPGAITAVLGLLFITVAALAQGRRERTMFGVGAALTGLVAALNLVVGLRGGGSGMVSTVLPAMACAHCTKARRLS